MVLFLKRIPLPTMSIKRTKSNQSVPSTKSAAKSVKEAANRRARQATSRKVGTEKTEIIKLHFQHFNTEDLKAAFEMYTDDFTFTFPGDYEIGVNELFPESQRMAESMPDFKFSARLVEEVTMENGTSFVVVHDLVAGGTHTGQPYQFGPYPLIVASGKYVKNDPEMVRFYFEGDKVCRAEILKAGKFSGPAGLYTQLGGLPLM